MRRENNYKYFWSADVTISVRFREQSYRWNLGSDLVWTGGRW